MSQTTYLNEYKIYPFANRNQFLEHLDEGNWNNILIALNAEKLVKKDEKLKKLVDQHIGYPDGIGPVLALKRKKYKAEKIPGAEFWLDIVKRFYKEKTFYLVGSKQHVIENTVAKLQRDFPGIHILNYRDGYIKDSEYVDLMYDVVQKKPDIVFVAMGSPKQEFVMKDMYEEHRALYMGLGGSFDVYTGEKLRAPKTLQKIGMEWSYRLYKEPVRIFRQMSLFTFAFKLITKKI